MRWKGKSLRIQMSHSLDLGRGLTNFVSHVPRDQRGRWGQIWSGGGSEVGVQRGLGV